MKISSVVTKLPGEVRKELDRRLVEHSFTGYLELTQWLKEQGYEISKSALLRYGKGYKARVEHARATVEKAKILVDSCPDYSNALNASLIMLAQSALFVKWNRKTGQGVKL